MDIEEKNVKLFELITKKCNYSQNKMQSIIYAIIIGFSAIMAFIMQYLNDINNIVKNNIYIWILLATLCIFSPLLYLIIIFRHYSREYASSSIQKEKLEKDIFNYNFNGDNINNDISRIINKIRKPIISRYLHKYPNNKELIADDKDKLLKKISNVTRKKYFELAIPIIISFVITISIFTLISMYDSGNNKSRINDMIINMRNQYEREVKWLNDVIDNKQTIINEYKIKYGELPSNK